MERLVQRSSVLLILWSLTAYSYAQYPAQWDLTNSIHEALQQAPQLKAFKTEIFARQSELDESNSWPNPKIEISVDDAVNLEQGNSGQAFSGLSISQSIPFGRLDVAERQARMLLSVAESQQKYKLLDLEKGMSSVFHLLQYQTDLLSLSEQRHESLEKILLRGKDPLIRFFTKTERKRLGILREEAHQAMAAAEGEYREAVSQFRVMLALPENYIPRVKSLKMAPLPNSLDKLLLSLKQHPLLISLQQSKSAAETGIEVARAKRRIDPELKLFSTRGVYAGREQTSNGIALQFEVPLWQSNDRIVARARADYHQQQSDLNIKQRDLDNQLRKSHMHIKHLIEQSKHYREKILTPANEILQLSSRGFRSGEINLLNFIDAHDTYYDAKAKYLMLIFEGWLETAEVRYSSGKMLVEVEL